MRGKLKRLLLAVATIAFATTLAAPAMAFADEVVAKIGDEEFTSFGEAMTTANSMTGEVTVEIYGKVEYSSSTPNIAGSYDKISFVGMTDDAEIIITRTGGGAYLQSSKTAAFDGLILSKDDPKWENNAGHMGHHFSIQGGTATYTDCVFPNGACTSKGTATYTECVFNNEVYYSLWIYDDAIVTVDTCTVNGVRGIKLYCEGDNNNDPEHVIIKNTTFTENLNEKAAVAITYGDKVELLGNTFKNPTPHIELNTTTDSNNNGTVIVAQDSEGNDISSTLTCVANGDPATAAKNGVLVTEADGTTRIYTTVAAAKEDATAGNTVTLLHNTGENVELPAGVTLNKNGKEAASVTVAEPDLIISDAAGLVAFAKDVNENGEEYAGKVVVLGSDIDLNGSEANPWTPIGANGDSSPKFRGTFLGQDHTISNLYVKQGAAYHAAGFFGATNGTIRNLTIDGAYVESISSGSATVNGTAVVAGSTAYGATIDNVHVKNATVKGNRYVAGIVGYMDGSVVNCSVENLTIVATPDDLAGSYDNGDKAGGIVGYCNSDAVEISDNELRGEVSITAYRDVAGIVGCASTGVSVNDNTNNATLAITVDQATNSYGEKTANAGEFVGRNTPAQSSGNATAESASCEITQILYPVYIGDQGYNDLQEAIKDAAPAGTVEIVANVTVDEWVMFAEEMTIGNGNLITLHIDGLTINGNGHTLTIESIESAGNGNRLFYDAENLSINDLTIVCTGGAANQGGIGLKSGVIEGVTFIGGGYGVLPGAGDVTIEGCTFKTNGTAIYYEEARDNLVVTDNTFELGDGTNVILLRGATEFTGNTIKSGRTVNIVSGSPVVAGNDFGDVRLKVYNSATAAISRNTINNLVFDDETPTHSAFSGKTLSEAAQAALAAVTPVIVVPSTPLPDAGSDCDEDAACNHFNDVDVDAWYHKVVDWAVENGILRGYDDGSGNVGPEDATMRTHVAVMMWRMAGEPEATADPGFKDVKAGAWYYDAVAWAKECGLLVGYQDGSELFGSSDVMIREQMAVTLWRFATMLGIDTSVGEDTNVMSYEDADQISEWAVEAMQWAVGSGIISGYTENGEPTGYLGPDDDAERAHFAAMLMRMDEAYGIL